ncbi:hypothetical protein AB4Z50_35160 [Paenibacillus sp. 2TAB26]
MITWYRMTGIVALAAFAFGAYQNCGTNSAAANSDSNSCLKRLLI